MTRKFASTQKTKSTRRQRRTGRPARSSLLPQATLQMAAAQPQLLSAQDVLHLQRTLGNRVTRGLLGRDTIQRNGGVDKGKDKDPKYSPGSKDPQPLLSNMPLSSAPSQSQAGVASALSSLPSGQLIPPPLTVPSSPAGSPSPKKALDPSERTRQLKGDLIKSIETYEKAKQAKKSAVTPQQEKGAKEEKKEAGEAKKGAAKEFETYIKEAAGQIHGVLKLLYQKYRAELEAGKSPADLKILKQDIDHLEKELKALWESAHQGKGSLDIYRQMTTANFSHDAVMTLLTPLTSNDVGQIGLSLQIGLSYGAAGGVAAAGVGGSINVNGSLWVEDDRKFRFKGAVGLGVAGKAKAGDMIGAEIGGQLEQGKVWVFQSADHWASWLGLKVAKLANSAMLKKHIDVRHDPEHKTRPSKERGKVDPGLLKQLGFDEKMTNKILNFSKQNVTKVYGTSLSGGGKMSAAGAGGFGLKAGGSIMEFVKKNNDGSIKTTKAHKETFSGNIDVMGFGTEVTFTYIWGHPITDNNGWYMNIKLTGMSKLLALPFSASASNDDKVNWMEKFSDKFEDSTEDSLGHGANLGGTEEEFEEKLEKGEKAEYNKETKQWETNKGRILNVKTKPRNPFPKVYTKIHGLISTPLATVLKETFNVSLDTLPKALQAVNVDAGSGGGGVEWNFVFTPRPRLQYRRYSGGFGVGLSGSIPVYHGLNLDLGGSASASKGQDKRLGTKTLTYLQTVYNGYFPSDQIAFGKENPQQVSVEDVNTFKDGQWHQFADQHSAEIVKMLVHIGEKGSGPRKEVESAISDQSEPGLEAYARELSDEAKALRDACQGKDASAVNKDFRNLLNHLTRFFRASFQLSSKQVTWREGSLHPAAILDQQAKALVHAGNKPISEIKDALKHARFMETDSYLYPEIDAEMSSYDEKIRIKRPNKIVQTKLFMEGIMDKASTVHLADLKRAGFNINLTIKGFVDVRQSKTLVIKSDEDFASSVRSQVRYPYQAMEILPGVADVLWRPRPEFRGKWEPQYMVNVRTVGEALDNRFPLIWYQDPKKIK